VVLDEGERLLGTGMVEVEGEMEVEGGMVVDGGLVVLSVVLRSLGSFVKVM
jgi:hypothetical protein